MTPRTSTKPRKNQMLSCTQAFKDLLKGRLTFISSPKNNYFQIKLNPCDAFPRVVISFTDCLHFYLANFFEGKELNHVHINIHIVLARKNKWKLWSKRKRTNAVYNRTYVTMAQNMRTFKQGSNKDNSSYHQKGIYTFKSTMIFLPPQSSQKA